VADKVALGQVFPRVLRFCHVNSTGAPLLGKRQKIIIIIVTFITGLHKKPQGCGASVASAAGPFSTKAKGHTMIQAAVRYKKFYCAK
jgi:hypothetical protein